MRRRLSIVLAMATMLIGAGCANAGTLVPVPVSPPYSGFTEPIQTGLGDGAYTNKAVYGCSTTGSTIWASVDRGPDEPGTAVLEATVNVFPGYLTAVEAYQTNVLPIGGTTFPLAASPAAEGNVVAVAPGQCFTIVVSAWSGSVSQAPTPGGIVSFTLNW